MNIEELAIALGQSDGVLFTKTELEECVALIAAHEREECAMLFQRFSNRMKRQAGECVDAIRARGKA